MNSTVLIMAALSAGVSSSEVIGQSLRHSGVFAITILVVISLLSILSWAVMGWKAVVFHRTRRQNRAFSDGWDANAGDLTAIYQEGAGLLASPNAKVFAEGYKELKALARVVERRPVITREIVESVERSIDRVIAREIIEMERYMIVLATTSNAAPLLGLLGTVWGILATFWMIGLNQNATIATVAPGVSEALITTVFGLVAAIPASMGYNYFQNRVNEIVLEMEDFSSRFLSLLERNISRESAAAEAWRQG